MQATTPEVTVVVIAFDDADRLPRAVASVLRQSHRAVEVVVVDDCSTDGTGEVADALAAAHPDRVRALHLETNSGGCSRPRNVGVAHARGEYVMFLDSDDELTPRACEVLSQAAREEGADFAAGVTVRVHLAQNGRETTWKPELYARREVVDGIAAKPDFVNDSLSTNKCWRREFLLANGLSFPEEMHYEDLVFTAEAYLLARRFVIVPTRVYTWYVDDSDATSITNRLGDLANLADRIEANRRIDGLYAAHGRRELKLAKDVKFVRHDLRLHVNELVRRDPAWQAEALELLAGYLADLDPSAPLLAGRVNAIEVFYVRHRDVDGVRTTFRYLRQGGKVSQPLVRRDGRLFWGAAHLDSEEGRAVLDVTDLGLDSLAHKDFPYFHRVTDVRDEDGRLRVSGSTLDQLGRLAGASLALRLGPHRLPSVGRTHPVSELGRAGDELRWTALLDLRTAVRPVGLVDLQYDVTVQARVGDEVNVSPLTLDPGVGDRPALPTRPRLTRVAGSHFRVQETRRGDFSLVLVGLTGASRRTHDVLARIRSASLVRRLRNLLIAAVLRRRGS
ncbi:MAG TPA: glycosyltransferase [Mycobacteriales bacterium]|nr:glycosyltransferase [Mycobacteriales bacterium]